MQTGQQQQGIWIKRVVWKSMEERGRYIYKLKRWYRKKWRWEKCWVIMLRLIGQDRDRVMWGNGRGGRLWKDNNYLIYLVMNRAWNNIGILSNRFAVG